MILKKKFNVPGFEEISSDDNTEDEILFLQDSARQIDNYETISIDDSLSDDDNDLIFVSVEDKRKHLNEVWRNIIECDLLDEKIHDIGFKKFRVNRDVESYDLPSFKLKRYKRTNLCRFRNFRRRREVRKPRCEIIQISSDDDDTPACNNVTKINLKKDKIEEIVIDDDEDSSDGDRDEVHEIISDSDTDSDEEQKLNTWNKLIDHLNQDQFQIEFDSGRETTARRMASELKEPKIDLIERCLIYLGLEKCQTFLTATKRIESGGGMPTKDGTRRRTAGGVFFTMIKSDRNIDQTVKEQIFLDNNDTIDDSESLWWKSVEINQYQRRTNSRIPNPSRRKEFKSYTLIDLDYFECFKDFRYRYIPMMSNFPLTGPQLTDNVEDNLEDYVDDSVMEIDLNYDDNSRSGTDKDNFIPIDLNCQQHIESDIFEIGIN